jgi:transcriptional regulator with XRE-family HTH domain
LDGTDVAHRLGWSASKISWIETDQWRRPNPRDVADLLDVYDVTDRGARERLLELARQARGRGWWAEYRDVLRGPLVEYETEAATIRTYEETVVPGLLQTAEYAQALFIGGGQPDIERRVAARMRRQQILDRVKLCVVVEEAALRKQVGGAEVMRKQLLYLADVSVHPAVAIRVLPLSAGAHPAMGGPFVILDFDQDPSIVYQETVAEVSVVESETTVQAYRRIYDQVKGMALSEEESRELIAALAAE